MESLVTLELSQAISSVYASASILSCPPIPLSLLSPPLLPPLPSLPTLHRVLSSSPGCVGICYLSASASQELGLQHYHPHIGFHFFFVLSNLVLVQHSEDAVGFHLNIHDCLGGL